MNKKSRRKARREKWKQKNRKLRMEARKEYKKEQQRLKALPKPLRKLEIDLRLHVDFMEVYDGYIGDFTGQVVPVEPIDNPFTLINKMEINFPHPNSLNDEQKEQYVWKIFETFKRIGFYVELINFIKKINSDKMYKLLLFHIENPTNKAFDIFNSVNYEDTSLKIERINFDYY